MTPQINAGPFKMCWYDSTFFVTWLCYPWKLSQKIISCDMVILSCENYHHKLMQVLSRWVDMVRHSCGMVMLSFENYHHKPMQVLSRWVDMVRHSLWHGCYVILWKLSPQTNASLFKMGWYGLTFPATWSRCPWKLSSYGPTFPEIWSRYPWKLSS